jgi:hypothetical protein
MKDTVTASSIGYVARAVLLLAMQSAASLDPAKSITQYGHMGQPLPGIRLVDPPAEAPRRKNGTNRGRASNHDQRSVLKEESSEGE